MTPRPRPAIPGHHAGPGHWAGSGHYAGPSHATHRCATVTKRGKSGDRYIAGIASLICAENPCPAEEKGSLGTYFLPSGVDVPSKTVAPAWHYGHFGVLRRGQWGGMAQRSAADVMGAGFVMSVGLM
jgi:hypothetical protein